MVGGSQKACGQAARGAPTLLRSIAAGVVATFAAATILQPNEELCRKVT